MNLGVLVIIALAAVLVAVVVLPRVRGISRAEGTTVERRSGSDRRQRRQRVKIDRRRRHRRTEDVARVFVDRLTE